MTLERILIGLFSVLSLTVVFMLIGAALDNRLSV